MSEDTIVPLRPRNEVPRRIQAGATTAFNDRLQVQIDGNVKIIRLLRGLGSVGLTVRMDLKSNAFVIEECSLTRVCPGCHTVHSGGSCNGEVTP